MTLTKEFLCNTSSYPGMFILSDGKVEPLKNTVGLTPRVANRALLHELGFCGMYTCYVGLGQNWGLSDMRGMVGPASKVNEGLGLSPKIESMIVRTRDVPVNGNHEVRLGGTNAMLIVEGFDEKFLRMRSISKEHGVEKLDAVYDPLEWWKANRVGPDSVYLIHEENRLAQEESIHARAGVLSDGAWEFSVGSGVPHARAIGENGFPYASMEGHDLSMMVEMVAENRGLGWPGFASNNWGVAAKMARDFCNYLDIIYDAMAKVKQRLGKNAVLEMRLYRGKNAQAGLQIYDFDSGFGVGGVKTLSGIRPSKSYSDEMILSAK